MNRLSSIPSSIGLPRQDEFSKISVLTGGYVIVISLNQKISQYFLPNGREGTINARPTIMKEYFKKLILEKAHPNTIVDLGQSQVFTGSPSLLNIPCEQIDILNLLSRFKITFISTKQGLINKIDEIYTELLMSTSDMISPPPFVWSPSSPDSLSPNSLSPKSPSDNETEVTWFHERSIKESKEDKQPSKDPLSNPSQQEINSKKVTPVNKKLTCLPRCNIL